MFTADRLRLLLATALLCLLGGPLRAETYAIDPTHTYASFEIDHLGFSTQRGQFNRSRGSLRYDPAQQLGEVDIHIDAASLDTGLAARDDILRGEDWFNVAANPDILFRSTAFVFEGNRLIAIDGRLALLGQTRPLRLDISRVKCGLNFVSRKRGCGADATATLRRSDFGLTNGLPFIGDEVRLRIQVEAYAP